MGRCMNKVENHCFRISLSKADLVSWFRNQLGNSCFLKIFPNVFVKKFLFRTCINQFRKLLAGNCFERFCNVFTCFIF